MSWIDRLREAAYTSPSGIRTVFSYEDVSRSVDKKGAAFNFPDADGTFIQDIGPTGRQYPLRIFFHGDDHDLQADAFENTLLETGAGVLDHPRYGQVDVVPFGSITQRDDLKTAANQSVFELTFWQTNGIVFPDAQEDPGSAVIASLNTINQAAADQFNQSVIIDTFSNRASLANIYKTILGQTKLGLEAVARATSSVEAQFNTVYNSIDQSIDTLVADPITLALQTSIFIEAPSRAEAAIRDRLEAYSALIDEVTASFAMSDSDREKNTFHTKDFFSLGFLSGFILSAVNNQFDTKSGALAVADQVLSEFDTLSQWRDDNFLLVNEIDTGESYQALQNAVALLAGFLVQISFTLKQERRIVLDRARSIIDLVAELYGSVDDQLDFFITSNNLDGDEILELPRGREIVYYI